MDRPFLAESEPENTRPRWVRGRRPARRGIEAAPEVVGPCPPRRNISEGFQFTNRLYPARPAEIRVAEARRAFGDGFENWLQLKGRAADDLQHLAYGRLLLERLLRFIEQADVLDRDRGLVGERFHQPDLIGAERLDLHPRYADHPHHLVAAEDRHAESGVHAMRSIDRPVVLRVAHHVGDVDRGAVQRDPANERAMHDRSRMRPLVFHELGDAAVRSHDLEGVSVAPEEICPIAMAELVRVLDDDVEDRLEIERRSANALEDVAGCRLLLERLLCLVEETRVLD